MTSSISDAAPSRPGDAAAAFTRALLLRQIIVGLAAMLVLAIFAHKLIVLDWEVTIGVFRAGAIIGLASSASTITASWLLARAHGPVVRAIAAGGEEAEAVSAEQIAKLAALPNTLTVRFLIVSAASTALLVAPGVRPPLLDDGRAIGLLILAATILAASALPHYVLARRATLKVLERAPLEPFSILLEALEQDRTPERLVVRKLLLAVVPPVALLGAGAVLVSHAHLRTLAETSSRTTAQMIARTALEPSPGSRAARDTAIAAAAQLGFDAQVAVGDLGGPTLTREEDGRMSIGEPVDDGRAVVSFTPNVATGDTTSGAVIVLAAVLLAAVFGSLFGSAFAEDLAGATRSVRLLGTEDVIRGGTRIARPARFAAVVELGRAIEGLAERFRVFAAAQERALEAKLAGQRMRGLLFASVSHDLKSPLNAILGFAELLATEELTPAQEESLALITRRGRELLALIETILDAARVEAGQLTLTPKEAEVAAVLAEATRKARELAGAPDAAVDLEIADDLPELTLDATYGVRAIAVILAHAFSVAAQRVGRAVRVRALADDDGVRLDVEYGRGQVTVEELENLFARRATSRARGITLGLSLARSVVELHGGSVEVERAPDGSPVVQVHLPFDVPDGPPRLSSIPALG
ncbi:MAG TPA: HAMP domain-containing sensor histidine kinase [Byssovorax sp.]